MATPVGETGNWFRLSQFGGNYGTAGITQTEEFDFSPEFIVAHVGLARVAAAEAAIGIAEFTDEGGRLVQFPNEAEWEPALSAQTGHLVFAALVARGNMTGWLYFQVWI